MPIGLVDVPGRHLPRADARGDRLGPGTCVLVADERHRRHVVRPMARFAFRLEDRRDILRERRRRFRRYPPPAPRPRDSWLRSALWRKLRPETLSSTAPFRHDEADKDTIIYQNWLNQLQLVVVHAPMCSFGTAEEAPCVCRSTGGPLLPRPSPSVSLKLVWSRAFRGDRAEGGPARHSAVGGDWTCRQADRAVDRVVRPRASDDAAEYRVRVVGDHLRADRLEHGRGAADLQARRRDLRVLAQGRDRPPRRTVPAG